ncbi:MAG: hypothetical protein AB7I98_03795 [Verrucomicrobiales bacterium]
MKPFRVNGERRLAALLEDESIFAIIEHADGEAPRIMLMPCSVDLAIFTLFANLIHAAKSRGYLLPNVLDRVERFEAAGRDQRVAVHGEASGDWDGRGCFVQIERMSALEIVWRENLSTI